MLLDGRARSRSVAACVCDSRLALPHRGEGAVGPGREEGRWGRHPPAAADAVSAGPIPGPGVRSCGYEGNSRERKLHSFNVGLPRSLKRSGEKDLNELVHSR